LVVIVIEPGFADSDDLGMFGCLGQLGLAQIGMTVRLVRMDTDAGPDIRLARGGADNPVPLAAAGGNIEEPANTGLPCPLQYACLILYQPFIFEMAMAIDQHQAASSGGSSSRGNNGVGGASA